jgi:hypothetical protein
MDLTLGSGWPYGGPHISAKDAAARLRVEETATPRLADGETLVAQLPMGAGIMSFISGRTRQTVKRPAMGSEGFVLDHYSRGALDVHLKAVGEPMLDALRDTPPYAVFSDSLEVYNADWTPDFLDQFNIRRGYDLTPHLPALLGEASATSAAVRHDWGKTLTELLEERYLKPLAEWAHSHKTQLRSQTYGIPPASLSSNALVDLPEGEGSDWRQFSTTRWSSSASHLDGRPVTSSETWTWLNSPAFRATPLDMKAEADRHFLQGINQLIGHGWPYSPPGAPEPGYAFYAAAVFNEHNPWWPVMPDVAQYLQRISFLLRQGRPVNDVAVYLPTSDAWANFTVGMNPSINQAMPRLLGPSLIPNILDAGYNFDFIDGQAIERVGVPHRILILPNVERIPLSAYRKIAEFARRGGVVLALGRTPSVAPGLLEAATDTPRILELSRILFEDRGARGRIVRDASQLGAALRQTLAPDAKLPAEVGFVHRALDSADVYFLANTTNHPIRGTAEFRVSGMASQWWDPFSGKVRSAGDARVVLNLAPYESRVLVFSKERAAKPAADGPPKAPIDISSGWTIAFSGASPVPMTLRSWTEEPEHRYFSGTAVYEKTVTLTRSQLTSGRELYLNFGEGTPIASAERRSGNGMRAMLDGPVREAAVVYINGKLAGSVWHPPYEVSVGGLLLPGDNKVRVVVANLAINQMAKGPSRDYKDLTARFGERFQQQDMANLQPLPSGLLGPIRILTR